MYIDNPLYEDRPCMDSPLKIVLSLLLAFTLVLGLIFLAVDVAGALALFGVTLLDALLFYCVIPRRYQIYSDRLKIVLGRPFALTIHYADIKTIKHVEGGYAWGSTGLRFATSTRFVVHIERRGKMSVTISPSSGEQFLDQINRALDSRPQTTR